MGKKRKGSKTGGVPVESYGSDDERKYAKEKNPDQYDTSFYNDEVDDFHSNKEKISLAQGARIEPAGFSSDEQEGVLDLSDDSDDEKIQEYGERLRKLKNKGFKDKLGSDLEDEDQDEGLPDEKAWGRKASKYYGADVSDDDDVDFSGSEPDAAILEEQEAMVIQKKMAAQLDEQDFGLDIFKAPEESKVTKEGESVKIEKDLSKLTKKEKIQLVKKESPELIELMEDYKNKMKEVNERLLPLQKLVREGRLPPSKGTEYLDTKITLYLNYCVTVSFYVMLKAKHTSIHNHPVVARLMQYRNLIQQLSVADKRIAGELDDLLDKVNRGEEIPVAVPSGAAQVASRIKQQQKLRKKKTGKSGLDKQKRKLSELVADSSDSSSDDEEGSRPEGGRSRNRKKKKEDKEAGAYETKGEKQALEYYNMMKGGRKDEEMGEGNDDALGFQEGRDEEGMDGQMGEGEWNEDDEKRGITKEMIKNKGLTPHRKKEYKNPRVKHRIKYRKAKIRRRGQIRETRTEMDRYSGEISGIRAGIKRSTKF